MSRHAARSTEDPERQRAILDEERRRLQQRLADVRAVLATSAGQRFAWDLLATAGILQRSYTGNSTTFYNEGRRAMGLDILELINAADPTAFARMLQVEGERADRALMQAAADAPETDPDDV